MPLQLLDSDVAELDTGAVSEKSDVAFGVGDSSRPLRRIQVAMLRQQRLVLHLVQIGVDDGRTVEDDGDPSALRGNLFDIPFANRLLVAALALFIDWLARRSLFGMCARLSMVARS